MEVLSKDMIRRWILPSLPVSAHGRPSVVEPVALVEAIFYKLKSGCQWLLLPVKQFFTGASLTWQGVVRPLQCLAQAGGVASRLELGAARKQGPPRLPQRPARRQPSAG